MGERAYEQARICDGRPAADSELTEEYNPLEAGLQSAISLTKVDSLPRLGRNFLFRCAQHNYSLLKLGILQGQTHLHIILLQQAHFRTTMQTSDCHMLNGPIAGMLCGG